MKPNRPLIIYLPTFIFNIRGVIVVYFHKYLLLIPNFLQSLMGSLLFLCFLPLLLTVPAYYALILRSLTVLEGLALYADPNFKVLAASYPYFAKRLLTDPNPYLRDALIELLFKDGKFRFVICCYLKSITG